MGGNKRSKGGKKTAEKSNPFDAFANAKRKHEVVNRRVKGEVRDVGRAREKATAQRKKRLTEQLRSTKSSVIGTSRRKARKGR